jgi:hypothetical protein
MVAFEMGRSTGFETDPIEGGAYLINAAQSGRPNRVAAFGRSKAVNAAHNRLVKLG